MPTASSLPTGTTTPSIAGPSSTPSTHGSPSLLLLLRASSWTITLVLSFLEHWANRFWLSPDGTNYLDIASAYLRRDWHLSLNPYWSPFFSWLLAFVLAIFKPSPQFESTALRLLNLVALLVALACFEFFVRSLLSLGSNSLPFGVPPFFFWLLAYSLFLSTSLFVLGLPFATTPDVWVSAFTYLLSGLLIRIRATGGSAILFSAFGLTLAFAYFAKTFYFPLSFVFLVTAWFAAGATRSTFKRLALAVLAFGLVAGS